IIDKSKFPRKKLCGGLITRKTIRLNERIFDETESSLKNKGIINYTSNGYELWNKNRLLVKGGNKIDLHFVDRENYDYFLLKKAGEAGVKIIETDKVIKYDIDKSTVTTASGKSYTARFVIGADGVNSIVRKSFPKQNFKIKKWRRNLINSIEIFIDRDDLDPDSNLNNLDKPRLYLSLVKYGYAWLFPREDRIVAGIGGHYKRNKGNLLKIFNTFLSYHGIETDDKTVLDAHSVPCGCYITRPVYKNSILVGDAGGYVDPLLGEGIFYAQRSAELASWAIHRNITEGRPLDKVYRKMLWKYILPEFFNARVTRSVAYYVSENLAHIPVKIVFGMMSGILHDVLQGTRSNRGFFKRKIHEDVTLNKISEFFTRPKIKNHEN
ncbi:MAG: tryptophan 7-halogenase, partial [Spirochaetes bacterium]|nr:tryptophan 7-halogenase [Spirochaetota bacterium]